MREKEAGEPILFGKEKRFELKQRVYKIRLQFKVETMERGGEW